jgi:Family of unknown function (DUF5681)
MSNTQNLKSYRKGQSGNLNGRPKGSRNVSTVLVEMLGEIAPTVIMDESFIKEIARTRKKATIAEAVAARIIYQGVVIGDSWALRELLDRTEGKAKQIVDIRTSERLDDAVDLANRMIRHHKELNEVYGVPMPPQDYLAHLVQSCAEKFGVDEVVLASKVQLPDEQIEAVIKEL